MDNSQEIKKKPRIKRKSELIGIYDYQAEYIPIDEPILKKISAIANEHNFEIYVVGGFVRDFFLNRDRHDIDITVVGDSIQFSKIVADAFNTKPVIYERFKTALVPAGKYHIEFVGTRKEEYLPDSRKPIVTDGTLEDDLKRRDFTVNAMAASLNNNDIGRLIDLFEGKSDLENKILRTPLEPGITFSDDPLRMMRAARFASQLNYRLENKAYEKMTEMADRIEIISQERITDEFFKIIDSDFPSIGLSILFQTGLLEHIFPELHNLAGVDIVNSNERSYAHKDVFRHSLKVLDNITPMTQNRWLRFAALVHDIAKPRTKRFNNTVGWTFHGHEDLGAKMMPRIFKRMKFPMDNLEYVQKIVRLHQRPMQLVDAEITDSAIRRLAVNAGSALEDLFTLCRADITTKNPNLTEQYKQNYEVVFAKVIDVQEKDKLREFQSPVRGEEIMEIFALQPSRNVGIIKTKIEEAILDGLIPNEYEPAKEFMLKYKDEWMKELGIS